jgi:hypothetical protein
MAVVTPRRVRHALSVRNKEYRLFSRVYRRYIADLVRMLLASCLMVATVNYQRTSGLLRDGKLP